jgi:hypothetical protein
MRPAVLGTPVIIRRLVPVQHDDDDKGGVQKRKEKW